MCNTHGHRLNNDTLERKGSGFVAHHGEDFMLANDKWFKGVSVQYGPAGDVFFIDWSDTGECHDVDITDREHGRLYRVAYQGTKPVTIDLAKESDDRLVDMQTWTNEWYPRHARLVLRDRGLTSAAKGRLTRMLDADSNAIHRLRALWTLHMCEELDDARLFKSLNDSDEYTRAWAIQFLAEEQNPSDEALQQFAELAKSDASPVVRLYLASALQRTPVARRRAVLEALIAHSEDSTDANLPLMYWYAMESVIAADVRAAAPWLTKAKIPKVRELIARRIAAK
jgi:hypothetical protein